MDHSPLGVLAGNLALPPEVKAWSYLSRPVDVAVIQRAGLDGCTLRLEYPAGRLGRTTLHFYETRVAA
jgi:hypothetical protein